MRGEIQRYILRPTLILALALAVLVSASSSAVSRELRLTMDDWRYRAMAELGAAGLLDPADSVFLQSGQDISFAGLMSMFASSVGRLLSTSDPSLSLYPLTLTIGPAQGGLSVREAYLVADLMREFGPAMLSAGPGLSLSRDASQGMDGLPAVARLEAVPQDMAFSGVKLSAPAANSLGLAVASGGFVSALNLGDVLLAMQPMHALVPANAPGISNVSEPLRTSPTASAEVVGPAVSPVTKDATAQSGRVKLSDILQVSAAFFSEGKQGTSASTAAIGVTLGDDKGSGLVVDHRVTGLPYTDYAALDRQTLTTVGVKYHIPNVVPMPFTSDALTVTAGYEFLGRDSSPRDSSNRSFQATAVLGIDYKLLMGNSAFLQAGYRYEKVRDLIASGAVWTKAGMYDDGGFLGISHDGTLKLNTSDATRMVASIDLGYRLFGDTSVILGYRLIDFSDIGTLDLNRNFATAEINIRF